ncbi:MAG: alkaline phosphatase family protein [Holophagae bacterium]
MNRDRFWIHGLVAGAVAGVLAEAMVMRLNPEVAQPVSAIMVGLVAWASWGALIAGVPIVVLQVLVRRIRRRPGDWPAPGLIAAVYFAAGVLAVANADIHRDLLSTTARRVLLQDAVAWLLGVVLALLVGALVRRRASVGWWRVTFAVLMLLVPAARLVIRPTTSAAPLAVPIEAVGTPNRPLVVVGVEGLDIPALLTYAGGGHAPVLTRVMKTGAWGSVAPYRPYLRQSYWTTLATGTNPGSHGVKAHWGWRLPWLDGTLRLLPWTPQGSRLILPWWLGRRVTPPESTVPALWQRLRVSGVATEVVGWPGFWHSEVDRTSRTAAPVVADEGLWSALEAALAAFPEAKDEIWQSIGQDRAGLRTAVDGLRSGVEVLWIRLGALATTRELLEPLKPRHTGEREVVELVMEMVDSQLGELLAVAPPDALVVFVSPYGLAPPSSYERLRRVVGIGDTWRTSGDRCWDGVLMIDGRGVAPGRRFQDRALADMVPTLLYLVGLPLAQYMEGEVVVDAIDPAFLETRPLVVDP